MTFYNIFQNLNMNYFSGFNNWFFPSFGMFEQFTMPTFNWNMPSLFSFDTFPPINLSSIFSNQITYSQSNINFNNTYNQLFNTPYTTQSSLISSTKSNSSIGDHLEISSPTVRYGTGQMGLVNRALSYKGKVNSDKEGNRLFSYGRSNQWCADFASYNVYETFGRDKMKSLGFPDAKAGSVASCSIWNWGKNKNRQIVLRGKNDQKDIIANQVKPGDIMIICRGTYSDNAKDFWTGHTAIVTEVNPDGSFKTIDGNSSNSVKENNHPTVPKNIVGFVRMDNLG